MTDNAIMRGSGRLIHKKNLNKKYPGSVPLVGICDVTVHFQDIIGSIHSAAQAIQPTEKAAVRSVKLLPFIAV
jgi:hypothetical protein